MAEYFPHPTTRKSMRVPLIVGADPGAERGYCMIDPEDIRVRRSWDAPRVVAMGTSVAELIDRVPAGLMRGRTIWAVTEFQYAQRVENGEISADSIIKLAFRAGYILRDLKALFESDDEFAVVPQRWKVELYGTGSTKRKDVFSARLMRECLPDELAVLQKIEERDDKMLDDVLDAIGIAWALWRVANRSPAHWRDWRCDPERIIPVQPPKGRAKRFQSAPQFNRTSFRPKESIR